MVHIYYIYYMGMYYRWHFPKGLYRIVEMELNDPTGIYGRTLNLTY